MRPSRTAASTASSPAADADGPPAHPDQAPLERPRRVRARQQRRDAPALRGGAHRGLLGRRHRRRGRPLDGDPRRASRSGHGHDHRPAGDRVPAADPVPARPARRAALARTDGRLESRDLLRGLVAGRHRAAGALRQGRHDGRAARRDDADAAPDHRSSSAPRARRTSTTRSSSAGPDRRSLSTGGS